MKKLATAVLILTLGFASSAFAAIAGKIIGSSGEVSALRSASESATIKARKLVRGSVIYDNDTIVTGTNSKAQIRFIDGTLLNLMHDTQFRIDAYSHDPSNAANNTSFFSLLKGGFRTITGLISKLHKKGFRLNASVATIGIRGTDFSVRLCQSDCPDGNANGLYTHVYSGGISISNESGQHGLDRGYSAFIPNAVSAPRISGEILQPLTSGKLPTNTAVTTASDNLVTEMNPDMEKLDDLIFTVGDAIQCLLQ